MDATTILFQNLTTMTELIADAVVKRVYPLKDELSTREAYATYGRAWVMKMEEEGRIRGRRVGGKVVFSRHSLDCLLAVELSEARAITEKYNR